MSLTALLIWLKEFAIVSKGKKIYLCKNVLNQAVFLGTRRFLILFMKII